MANEKVGYRSVFAGWAIWCGNKKIKFRKNFYQTSDPREMALLDQHSKDCTRIPRKVDVIEEVEKSRAVKTAPVQKSKADKSVSPKHGSRKKG